MQNDLTKASKQQIIALAIKADGGKIRGQTHGAKDTNVGQIAGCISLKQRKNAPHFIGVFEVSGMSNTETANRVKLNKGNRGAKYVVHCFASGKQVAVPTRRAGMHSARVSGGMPNGAFAKGAVSMWCKCCIKAMSCDDSEE